jgi:hypothetical protein
MKKQIKISEDTMSGIGTVGQTNTSTTTASPIGTNKKSISVKKKDLTDPTVQNYINKTKDVNVTVLDEDALESNQLKKLQYLSNVRDAKDGVSQPFTIGEKRYQMVRALTPSNEKTLGVYSLDETDGDGENIIYDAKTFEETIAKKAIAEEGVVEPEAPEMDTLNPDKLESEERPSFAGYRHFIVNDKTGKARKFKTIEELAQAQMGEGERYMGMRSFKKYVDEALFGQAKKRNVTEVDAAPTTVATDSTGENDVELQAKAQKLMDIIKRRVPDSIIKTIVTPLAKREVIAAFAEMIGVPRNGLAQLVAGIKSLAKTPPQPAQPVSESKIIKVKDIKK